MKPSAYVRNLSSKIANELEENFVIDEEIIQATILSYLIDNNLIIVKKDSLTVPNKP